jgi:hypothetical protein
MRVIQICNWDETFETRSEKYRPKGPLPWVAIPTKHDGTGYKTVLLDKNGPLILCAWWAMVQVAAKMPDRGVLANENGPFDAERLAIKTGLPLKIFKLAFDLLANQRINWIRWLEWDENLSFAQFRESLRASARVSADSRETARVSGDDASSSTHEGNGEKPRESAQIVGDSRGSARISADSRESAPTGQDKTIQDNTHKTGARERESLPGAELITDYETAQQVISEHVFRETDPGRWSHQAMEGLSHHLPIRRKDVKLMSWFHRIPPDDSVQELKTRRQSPGTLMPNWSDEVIRARRFREKIGAGMSDPDRAKKEPARWKEFFRWKYGEDIRLPERFDQLGGDQLREWETEHEKFEAEAAKK